MKLTFSVSALISMLSPCEVRLKSTVRTSRPSDGSMRARRVHMAPSRYTITESNDESTVCLHMRAPIVPSAAPNGALSFGHQATGHWISVR